jgi:hypothetical protein
MRWLLRHVREQLVDQRIRAWRETEGVVLDY